jgi:hypothetical protein
MFPTGMRMDLQVPLPQRNRATERAVFLWLYR